MKSNRYVACAAVVVFVLCMAAPAIARSVRIEVKTVHAKQGPKFEDPRLSDLIRDLKSLFRYSSYKLMGSNNLNLGIKQAGRVPLPGNRVLKITPTRIKGNRAQLKLVISKKKKEIFQTRVQILNGGSITVGGPKHKDGYLLFNISNSF